MNIPELDEFLNSDKFKLPSAKVSDFSLVWTPKDPGTYVIRVLPPHPTKCSRGVGFNIIHWGIASKGSVRCSRMDPDYMSRKEAMMKAGQGDEPCLCCRLYDYFVKNEGKNEKMQEIRNDIRPQKLLLYPVYLPKVVGWNGKIPLIDESCEPSVAVWQVNQYTLQKSMETITKSNELLTDPMLGKFIILTITNQKAAKKYPSPDFHPMMGGLPIHSNPAVMANILDSLYPDVSKIEEGGKRKDEDIHRLIMENPDIRPYLG